MIFTGIVGGYKRFEEPQKSPKRPNEMVNQLDLREVDSRGLGSACYNFLYSIYPKWYPPCGYVTYEDKYDFCIKNM